VSVKITRARILSGHAHAGGTAEPPTPRAVVRRRLPAAVASAQAEAARIVDDALVHVETLEAHARERVADMARLAAEEAREIEIARLAAVALYLDARARTYTEAEVERAVDLARLLAERVIGAELSMDPSRVALMAAELLGEARGASTARIFGCREDIEELRRTFASLGFSGGTATFEEDPSLLRGSLVVESDVGTVDGRLETRLPRFADALLEALRHG
jgi:flagellar biosynthesis/type III secretory pathway protein FliH